MSKTSRTDPFTFRYDVRWGKGGKLQPHRNGEITVDAADEATARQVAAAELAEQFKEHAPVRVTVQARQPVVEPNPDRVFAVKMQTRTANLTGELRGFIVQDADDRYAKFIINELQQAGYRVEEITATPPRETP